MEEDDNISLEDVDIALMEIENKYSPNVKLSPTKIPHSKVLSTLSNEFDSLGLPCIDVTQDLSNILEQVVATSHCLVQLHRKTLGRLQEANSCVQSKKAKNSQLKRDNTTSSKDMSELQKKYDCMENSVKYNLTDKIHTLQKKELCYKDDIQKLKYYCSSKETEAKATVQKLANENKRLTMLLIGDFGKNATKASIVSKLMNEYNQKEQLYTTTIVALQNNIAKLKVEIIDLREELNEIS